MGNGASGRSKAGSKVGAGMIAVVGVSDGDGKLSSEEFAAIAAKVARKFDVNGDGIDADQLAQLLDALHTQAVSASWSAAA